MDKLTHLFRLLSNVTGIAAMVALACLMFGITLDVLSRYLFDKPVSGVFEVAESSMVLIVYLGLGWTFLDDAHIRVTLVTDRLGRRPKRWMTQAGWIITAGFLLLLAWSTSKEAIHSWQIREFRWGYVEFPIWWVKISLAFGLWFAALQIISHCVVTWFEKPEGTA